MKNSLSLSLKAKTSLDNYIFSKKAAEEITGVEIYKVTQGKKDTIICDAGNCKIYVEKQKFLNRFAESRLERSTNIKVEKIETDYFIAKSQRGDKEYDIQLGEIITCTCKDWRVQQELGFKTPCCKHIYKVLAEIGIYSYRDYLNLKF